MEDGYNASNEELVKQQREYLKTQSETLMEDYRKLLRTPEGRRFFKHFFKIGKLTDISMTGNSWTFFHEGHRNFTKIVYNEICQANAKAAAEILFEVTEEAVKEQKK